jgi:DNA-binding transcriptional MerR regulator
LKQAAEKLHCMQIAFDFSEQAPKPKPAPKKEKQKKIAAKRGRKSLKEMVSEAEMISLPPEEELRKKHYYNIGEVSQMFGLNPSSLRFWETEFNHIRPRKNKKGDRFYSVDEIKKIQLIYFLLRQRKYTIEGAKDYIKKYKDEATVRFELTQSLNELKSFLIALKADL